jgi:hypothetical protein
MPKTALGYISIGQPRAGRPLPNIDAKKTLLAISASAAGYSLKDTVVGFGDDEAAIEGLLQRAISENIGIIFAAAGRTPFKDPSIRKKLEESCAAHGITLIA